MQVCLPQTDVKSRLFRLITPVKSLQQEDTGQIDADAPVVKP